MSNVWLEAPRPGGVARARVRSSADVREIERIPHEELLPAWSSYELLQLAAARTPSKPAIIVEDTAEPTRNAERITYGELAAAVCATANRLHAVSGESRPVVSVVTPLLPEAYIALWAGATAGTANPLHPLLPV